MATGNNGAGCGRARTVLCTALIAALLCGLCGCGDESKPESSQPAVTEKRQRRRRRRARIQSPKRWSRSCLKDGENPLTLPIIKKSRVRRVL